MVSSLFRSLHLVFPALLAVVPLACDGELGPGSCPAQDCDDVLTLTFAPESGGTLESFSLIVDIRDATIVVDCFVSLGGVRLDCSPADGGLPYFATLDFETDTSAPEPVRISIRGQLSDDAPVPFDVAVEVDGELAHAEHYQTEGLYEQGQGGCGHCYGADQEITLPSTPSS